MSSQDGEIAGLNHASRPNLHPVPNAIGDLVDCFVRLPF